MNDLLTRRLVKRFPGAAAQIRERQVWDRELRVLSSDFETCWIALERFLGQDPPDIVRIREYRSLVSELECEIAHILSIPTQ